MMPPLLRRPPFDPFSPCDDLEQIEEDEVVGPASYWEGLLVAPMNSILSTIRVR
jgi:hypothetical protein